MSSPSHKNNVASMRPEIKSKKYRYKIGVLLLLLYFVILIGIYLTIGMGTVLGIAAIPLIVFLFCLFVWMNLGSIAI